MLGNGMPGHIKSRGELFIGKLFLGGKLRHIRRHDLHRFRKRGTEIEQSKLTFDFILLITVKIGNDIVHHQKHLITVQPEAIHSTALDQIFQ